MKTSWAFVAILITLFSARANAGILEVGDLNIIHDAGNPSDGLRFLDLSHSLGLTKAAALANAQATYADARFATAAEANNLFDATTLIYDGSLTLGDAFTGTGTAQFLSGFDPYNGNYNHSLWDALGRDPLTSNGFWTNHDGSSDPGSTFDVVSFLEASPPEFGAMIALQSSRACQRNAN